MDDAPNDLQSQRDATGAGAPTPLEYESPRDQLARNRSAIQRQRTTAFILGFIPTAIGTAYANLVVIYSNETDLERPGLSKQRLLLVTVYGLLTLATILLLVLAIRRPLRSTFWRWGVLGVLFAWGLSFLLGGLCFAVL